MKRRTFLLGAGAFALAGCSDDAPRLPPATVTPTSPAAAEPPKALMVEYVRSAARGRQVTMVVVRPEGALDQELPVCVALHGRGSDARMIVQLGVPELLTSSDVPFAMVGLDGGDSYWVARDPGDDPQRMLADELPGWLGERNLQPQPFGVFGLSMGAYGALNYARRVPHPAVAVISPALFLDWPDAQARDAFAGEGAWAATDPLQHVDGLGDARVGVWCGTEDPFHPAARKLAELATPQVADFQPGGHDADYWLRTMPDVVRFLGERAGA